MGWEWRAFYQAAEDAPPPLPQKPHPPESRTDVYHLQDRTRGLKERGGGRLEVKERVKVDDRGYEKWKKSRPFGAAPAAAAPHYEVSKRRWKQSGGWRPAATEYTELRVRRVGDDESVNSGASQSWRTVAVEGNRQDCEPVRQQLLDAISKQAVGPVTIGGYPTWLALLHDTCACTIDITVPEPQAIARDSTRRYGSIKHIAAGDVVEAWLDGAWSDEPFTVLEVIIPRVKLSLSLQSQEIAYRVKQGIAGAPDFTIDGEPPWTPDASIGVTHVLKFPEQLRPGDKFKEVLDEVPVEAEEQTPAATVSVELVASRRQGFSCIDSCNAALEKCFGGASVW